MSRGVLCLPALLVLLLAQPAAAQLGLGDGHGSLVNVLSGDDSSSSRERGGRTMLPGRDEPQEDLGQVMDDYQALLLGAGRDTARRERMGRRVERLCAGLEGSAARANGSLLGMVGTQWSGALPELSRRPAEGGAFSTSDGPLPHADVLSLSVLGSQVAVQRKAVALLAQAPPLSNASSGSRCRGLIRLRAGRLDEQVTWDQGTPPTKSQGDALLRRLLIRLGPEAGRRYAQAVLAAQRFMRGCPAYGCVPSAEPFSFRDAGGQLEVVVQSGQAFVDE